MKIENIDENNIIVFLNKMKTKEELTLSSASMEKYFKKIFELLKNNYNIDIGGYYHITLYQDAIYGNIIEIVKDFSNYFEYFDNQVDMKIDIVKNNYVLYEINDYSCINNDIFKYINLYIYKNKIYIKPKKSISQYLLGNIIENSNIIYGEKSLAILKNGKIINSKYNFI